MRASTDPPPGDGRRYETRASFAQIEHCMHRCKGVCGIAGVYLRSRLVCARALIGALAGAMLAAWPLLVCLAVVSLRLTCSSQSHTSHHMHIRKSNINRDIARAHHSTQQRDEQHRTSNTLHPLTHSNTLGPPRCALGASLSQVSAIW